MFVKIVETLKRLLMSSIFNNLFIKWFRKIFTTKEILSPNESNCLTITKMSQNLTKTDAKNIIVRAKQDANLTFEAIAKRLGVSKVIYLQHSSI